MKDEAIVELYWERDENALSESRKSYGNYCMYIARNLLGDIKDSEECLDDVLLAAWNSIPPHRPSNLKTYLGKLARETAVDCLRRKSALKRTDGTDDLPFDELEEVIGDYDVETVMEEKELSQLVTEFLRSLREDERNIFIRRYWFYAPVRSISQRYGFGQSKVLVTLKRTRDKLAEFLKKEGYLNEKR